MSFRYSYNGPGLADANLKFLFFQFVGFFLMVLFVTETILAETVGQWPENTDNVLFSCKLMVF